jgi:DNA (cytosine-5)-methyltransferase 1
MKSENINLLYIDLFCGAGGTSTGVESAIANGEKCAKVIACVNHDANAIASHAANHPDALHFTEDIRTLELSPLIEHAWRMKAKYPEALLVLWMSLECTNFSKAKGGQSRDADSRTLAEHAFRYFDGFESAGISFDYIQIENVEEFKTWGPLIIKVVKDKDGSVYCPCKVVKEKINGEIIKRLEPQWIPDPEHIGEYYERWIRMVKRYGYKFEDRILNAADFGAYTSRKRFFGQFAKIGLPIVWPEPTHAKESQRSLFGNLQKWKPVKEVLDFLDEGKSIFNRKKPLTEKTLERIYAGLIKFVAGGKDKWLLKYNSTNGKTGKHVPPSIDEPCPTISCQGRLGVASVKFLSKYFSGHPDSKNISIEGPAHTIKTKDNHALITSNFITAYYSGGGQLSDIKKPCPTLTTKDRITLVSTKFIDQQYGQSKPTGTDQPLGALTTNPKYALVSPKFIMNQYSNGGQTSDINKPAPAILSTPKQNIITCKWHYLLNPQFNSAGSDIEKPCFTLIAKMDKRPPYLVVTESGQAAIEIYESDSPMTVKIKEFMALYRIIDIKMRMLKILELLRIMGFPADYKLIGTQADQKKYIGNAVEVNMAKALCSAISTKLHESSEIKMAI